MEKRIGMEKGAYTQQHLRQRILIVGNLGYIGSVLANHFKISEPNSQLIGLDTGFFSGCLIDPCISMDHRLDEQIYADVRQVDLVNLPDADVIIYLAAISNDPMGNIYERPTIEINHEAAIAFAKIYKLRGAKSFVFASSCSVYGASGDSAKREDDSLNPLTAYALSKIGAEMELATLGSEDFSITCLRFATACGASPRLRLDLVLNDFVASALLKREIEILSDGMPWRPLIDVEDMCKAIAWAKDRNTDQHFLAVNVGFESWNHRIKDLATAVSKNLKGVQVRVNPNAAPDRRSYRVDFSLYKKLAPFNQNSKSLDATIAEIADNISSAAFKADDFRKSHLVRLNTIKNLRERGRIDDSLYWKF